MKKAIHISVILPFLSIALILPGQAAAAEMHGGDYTMQSTVISNGGVTMSSGPYQMTGTLGQPSPLAGDEQPNSGSYQLKPGFWPAVTGGGGSSCTADFLGDGDVDGLDLYLLAVDSSYIMPLNEFTGQFGKLCE